VRTEVLEIFEHDILIRLITNQPNFLKADGTVTSAVFKKTRHDVDLAVSVKLEKLIEQGTTYLDKKVGKIKAEIPMSLDCRCQHTPKEEDYPHASIFDMTDSKAKKIAKSCQVFDSV